MKRDLKVQYQRKVDSFQRSDSYHTIISPKVGDDYNMWKDIRNWKRKYKDGDCLRLRLNTLLKYDDNAISMLSDEFVIHHNRLYWKYPGCHSDKGILLNRRRLKWLHRCLAAILDAYHSRSKLHNEWDAIQCTVERGCMGGFPEFSVLLIKMLAKKMCIPIFILKSNMSLYRSVLHIDIIDKFKRMYPLFLAWKKGSLNVVTRDVIEEISKWLQDYNYKVILFKEHQKQYTLSSGT